VTDGRGLGAVDGWLRRHPVYSDVGLAVLLAAVLMPASVPLVLDSAADAGTKAVVVTAVILAQVSVAFRRLRPVAGYLACSAAMAVLVAAPSLTGLSEQGYSGAVPPILLPSAGVFLVLLYSVAVYTERAWPVAALVVAAVGAAITTVRVLSAQALSTIAPTGLPLPAMVGGTLAALVLAAWSVGRFRRVRADYVISLAQRAEQAEADRALRAEQAAAQERARIARDMHDVVSHSLAVMIAQAEAGRMAAVKDPQQAVAVLPIIAGTGREAMSDMRSLLGILRADPTEVPAAAESDAGATDVAGAGGETRPGDPALADPGGGDSNEGSSPVRSGGDGTTARIPDRDDRAAARFVESAGLAPQPGLADIPDLIDRIGTAGQPVLLTGRGSAVDIGPVRELTAFRVVQESLTNVLKHAGDNATPTVDLAWSPTELTITVTNRRGTRRQQPSVGVRADLDPAAAGRGLRGMRERVESVGGRLAAGVGDGGGFRVVATIPVSSARTGVASGTAVAAASGVVASGQVPNPGDDRAEHSAAGWDRAESS